MTLASRALLSDDPLWPLGWGFRVTNFEGLALFVEITLSGCIYLVLDLERPQVLIEARSESEARGKIAAVAIALQHVHGRNHEHDPAHASRGLQWYCYPL